MPPTGGSRGPPPPRPSPRPRPCPGFGAGWGRGHEQLNTRTQTGDGAMTVLELRDVSKAYGQGAGRVEALRQVDLTVWSGGWVAGGGPGGSGETTLHSIARSRSVTRT